MISEALSAFDCGVRWATEKGDLQVVGDEALKACAETQKYFATSERLQVGQKPISLATLKADLPPSEAFFLHIAAQSQGLT